MRKLIRKIGNKYHLNILISEKISSGILYRFILDKVIEVIRGFWICLIQGNFKVLFIGRNTIIHGKQQFRFGKFVSIGNKVEINAYGERGFYIGDFSKIASNSFVKVSFSINHLGKYISIGEHTSIGEFAHLGGAGGLAIGDNCIIGPYFSCHPENHNFHEEGKLFRLQGVKQRGISIGNNCWIGAKVTILDGVCIGNNCVIAAGAVVNKNIPDNAVVAGVPAKVISYHKVEKQFESKFYNAA